MNQYVKVLVVSQSDVAGKNAQRTQGLFQLIASIEQELVQHQDSLPPQDHSSRSF